MTIDPAQLNILFYPAPALRAATEPVDPSDPVVQAVAARMIELMFTAKGAGLAAPQVGLPWRLFVTLDPANPEKGLVWMNPTIAPVDGSELETEIEGCLSLPGIEVEVERPSKIRLDAYAIDGKAVSCDDEILSRVFQHESDHLDGILIIDKMSIMERIRNRKLLKQLKQAVQLS